MGGRLPQRRPTLAQAQGPGIEQAKASLIAALARNALAQAGQVALAVQILNRMIREARPVTVRRT